MNKLIEFLKNLGGAEEVKEERCARRYQRGYLRMQRERVIKERATTAREYGIPLEEAGMFAKSASVQRQLRQPGKVRTQMGVHRTSLISFN